ncbi:MAG: methyltransferase [Rhizobiales bacterium]|nr:methyltransferase [Hyphomicrobiales bacterium]
MRHKIKAASTFIKTLVKSPQAIGAVMPSGKKLCRAMVKAIEADQNSIYVEVGAGTGVVTKELIAAGIPPHNIYLFENEINFIPKLKILFPDAHVIHGDVQFLQKHLTALGVGKVSKIISSLPFKSLPQSVVNNILEQFDMVLKKDGKIVQFTYSVNQPYSETFKQQYGFEAEKQAYIPQNIPPATVWLYKRKP